MLKNKHPVRYGFEAAQVLMKVIIVIELHPGCQLFKVTVYSIIIVDHKIVAATKHPTV